MIKIKKLFNKISRKAIKKGGIKLFYTKLIFQNYEKETI